MKPKQIFSTSITGTGMMTLYSYLLSAKKNKDFREPYLLGQLIYRITKLSQRESLLLGWLLHYGVGILFAMLYIRLWKKRQLNPTFLNNAALGVATGVFAVAIWHSVLTMHPKPPYIDRKRFYGQLIIAHIIFGSFAAMGYKATALKPSGSYPGIER